MLGSRIDAILAGTSQKVREAAQAHSGAITSLEPFAATD
jgi:hypothetical protein